MKITWKLLCPEVTGELSNGAYEVTDGLCTAEALACCADLPRERVESLMYMCGGKHIRPDTVLQAGDELLVLRPLRGG